MKKWIVLKAVYDEGCIRGIDFWRFPNRGSAGAFISRDYRRVVKSNDLTDETCQKRVVDGRLAGAYCATADGCFQVKWTVEEDKKCR